MPDVREVAGWDVGDGVDGREGEAEMGGGIEEWGEGGAEGGGEGG